MYGWIWRHLPFGLPGKLAGSALLITAAVALLWFWVFPAVEPLLPFDDVQVTGDEPAIEPPEDPGVGPGVSPGAGTGPASPGASPSASPGATPGPR